MGDYTPFQANRKRGAEWMQHLSKIGKGVVDRKVGNILDSVNAPWRALGPLIGKEVSFNGIPSWWNDPGNYSLQNSLLSAGGVVMGIAGLMSNNPIQAENMLEGRGIGENVFSEAINTYENMESQGATNPLRLTADILSEDRLGVSLTTFMDMVNNLNESSNE